MIHLSFTCHSQGVTFQPDTAQRNPRTLSVVEQIKSAQTFAFHSMGVRKAAAYSAFAILMFLSFNASH